MIKWMKNVKKETRTNEEEPRSYEWKVYITFDQINGELIESSAPINWNEFLNRPIAPSEQEEDLFKELQSDNFYLVGQRLVKYKYAIPYLKVIVCEMARLTKKEEKMRNAYGVTTAKGNLDEAEKGEEEGLHIIKKDIRNLQEGEKINV